MRRFACLLLSLFLIFSLVGCQNDKPGEGEYQVYYMNMNRSKLVAEAYDSTGATGEDLVWELLKRLETAPRSAQLRQTIPTDLEILSVKVDGSYLSLDFGSAYKKMSVTDEVLVRAAIVRTLSQIEGFTMISFTVESEPLRTVNGVLVGGMNGESFVENPGEQINSMIETTVKLYFSSEDGIGLVEESRTITHSSSTSPEKLVMEALIEGPESTKARKTIPSATKIMNVSVIEGVCYVNLDSSFQNQDQEIQEEVVLYSIVNSLTELTGITKVQLSINGDTKGFCRYTYELSKMYEKNLSLVDN